MTHNLPTQTTPFVGRHNDIEQIDSLLQSNPLVTVVGMGGMGKTRLAIAVGQHITQTHSDCDVYFVSLVPVTHHSQILGVVANVIGLSLTSTDTIDVQISDFLADRHVLLIIDNFEHVIQGASHLNRLLDNCPNLRILATSREKLRLKQEYTYAIKAMHPPDNINFDESGDNDVIQLFTQIAQKVNWNFRLTAENFPYVIQICRRVNGIPLAIELSAAWLRMMSVDEILKQLDTGYHILADSLNHLPERHQSIRAVFESSWQLLTLEEQQLYCQLSIFHGGFTKQTIENMLGTSPHHLLSLIDRSLVSPHINNRYSIHELLRQYAGEKLIEFPDLAATIHDRHADYFATFLEQRVTTFKINGKNQSTVVQEIDEEIDNIRSMWYYALDTHQFDIIIRAVETIYHVNRIRGTYVSALQMFDDAKSRILEAQLQSEYMELYTQLTAMMAIFAGIVNDFNKVPALADEAIQLATEHNFKVELARGVSALAVYWTTVGDLEQAKYYGEQAVKYYEGIDDIEEHTNAAIYLGWTYQLLEDYPNAEKLFMQLADQHERTGNIYQAAQGNIWLALLNNLQGKYLEGKHYGLKALSQFESINGEAYRIATRKNIAVSYWGLGNYDEARHYFLQTLDIFVQNQFHFMGGILSTMSWMVHLIYSEGDSAFAAELSQFILNHPEANHETREIVNKVYPILQKELPDVVLETAIDRAQVKTIPEIVNSLYNQFRPKPIMYTPSSSLIKSIVNETIATGVIPDDVTDEDSREIAEAVIQHMQDTLEKEKSHLANTFMENASHDLRTPITIINNSLYLLEHIQDTDRQKDKLNLVKSQVNHLHQIIEHLLLISRLESRDALDLQKTDLVSLLRTLHAQFSPNATQKDYNFVLEILDHPISVDVDISYIRDAIAHLVDNAFDHTDAGGTIKLSCVEKPDSAIISVIDTGVGISPENVSRIFEPFYKSDIARSDNLHAGLGLAIVRTIAQAHGGRCTVQSTPGQGSTFEIYLPRA